MEKNEGLEEQLVILKEKIKFFRVEYAIKTDSVEKFGLRKEIEKLEIQIGEIGKRLAPGRKKKAFQKIIALIFILLLTSGTIYLLLNLNQE